MKIALFHLVRAAFGLDAVLCKSGDPIEGWRGSGSFVETGKLVNRSSGGAESQNRRRLAKFSRLVETVRARVERSGKMPCPAPDSLLCPGHLLLLPLEILRTVQTRVLIGGNPISGSGHPDKTRWKVWRVWTPIDKSRILIVSAKIL